MGDRRQRSAACARRGRRVSVRRRRRADVRADGQRCTASRPIPRWSSRSTSSSGTCRPSSASSRAASSKCGRRAARATRGSATCRPSIGSDATRQGSSVFGGPLSRSTALTVGALRAAIRSLSRSRASGQSAQQRQCGERDRRVQLARCRRRARSSVVGGFGRSSFDVPHNEEQEEAGQDQRQENLQTWQTASWQRAWSGDTVSQVAAYHRSGSAALFGSEHDTPLHINADRTLRRTGVLGSVTHHRGKHVMKAGVEAARLEPARRFLVFRDRRGRRRRSRSERRRARARRGQSVRVQRPGDIRRCFRSTFRIRFSSAAV